jgi:hypothetical protein
MGRKRKAEEPEAADAAVYTIRIEPQLVPRLKMVSAALGISGPNYVNSRLEVIIDRELRAAIAEMGLAPAGADDAADGKADLQKKLDLLKPVARATSAARQPHAADGDGR